MEVRERREAKVVVEKREVCCGGRTRIPPTPTRHGCAVSCREGRRQAPALNQCLCLFGQGATRHPHNWGVCLIHTARRSSA